MKFQPIAVPENYPHTDFAGPCGCAECCFDEESGYTPSCSDCRRPTHVYGICVECNEMRKNREFIAECWKNITSENLQRCLIIRLQRMCEVLQSSDDGHTQDEIKEGKELLAFELSVISNKLLEDCKR